MAGDCDYYIGTKKYTEKEFKKFLLEGGYDDFVRNNHINPSRLKQSLPTQEVKAALPTGQKLTQDETDLLKAIDIAEKGLAEGKDFEEIAKEGMTDTDTGNAGWLAHFNRYFNWKKSIWDKADRESVKKELLDKQAKAEQPTVLETKATEQKIAELEAERDARILKEGKPDVKLEFVSAKELVDSKDPIGNRNIHNDIKERFKKLKEILDCIHG